MTGQEGKKGLIVHVLGTESTAQLKAVGFCQFPEGIIVFGYGAGFLGRNSQGDEADQEGEEKGKKAFHKGKSPLGESDEFRFKS